MVPILEKHQSGLAAIAPDHQIENLHSQIDKLKYQLNARSKGKINYNWYKIKKSILRSKQEKADQNIRSTAICQKKRGGFETSSRKSEGKTVQEQANGNFEIDKSGDWRNTDK